MDLPESGKWWSVPLSRLYESLGSGAVGLPQSDAGARLRVTGPNTVDQSHDPSVLERVVGKLFNPLNILLIVAGGMSAVLGQVTDFVIILVITTVSVALDVGKEHSARRAAEKLKRAVAVSVSVLRDGRPHTVSVSDIVPGDVIDLKPGNIVPADGRLVSSEDLSVDQSMLTGESYPQQKRADAPVGPAATLSERVSSLYLGTHVMTGSGRLLAVATGRQTEMGRICLSVGTQRPPTSFERGLTDFGLLLTRCAMVLGPAVFAAHAVTGHKPLESVLFVLALVVGFAPELLPVILSITLARGAERIAKKHAIVKTLSAIENFGNMDVLCTDKTGTLTENALSVARMETATGIHSSRPRELAALACQFQSSAPGPLDAAITEGMHDHRGRWRKTGEVAFDFERKRGSVAVTDGTVSWMITKGAPDWLVDHCSLYEENGRRAAMTQRIRETVTSRIAALAMDGYRTIAVCYKPVHDSRAPTLTVHDERGMVLAGILAFSDPPKASAKDALQRLSQSGVSVRVVTGDDELVARHVCTQLDLEVRGVASGSDIAAWSDRELASRIEGITVFARLTPDLKRRVIRAFSSAGHVVGYMGDGINDAPSLVAADVGISVADAVDVAKDSADIILLRKDLHVLHDGVIEGRKTFANVMKYIMMGTSSNFGNMISVALSSLVLPFLPLLPTQVLLNDMLYDLSQLLLSRDRVDHDAVRHPGNWDIRFVKRFMLVFGPVSSLFDLLTFYLLFSLLHAAPASFQTGWFTESFITQTVVIFSIRTHMVPFFRSRPDGLFSASLIGMIAVVLAVPYTPVGAWFGFVPLPFLFYAALVGIVVAYVALVEVIKLYFYRRVRHARQPRPGSPVPVRLAGSF